jgi:hypothetical protein
MNVYPESRHGIKVSVSNEVTAVCSTIQGYNPKVSIEVKA